MSFEGKVVLVTGASRGIGKAIATKLGKLGAIVAGTATSESGANNISAYLAEAGIQGAGFAADVSSNESVDALFAAISEKFGAPLIVVNNAGITKDNLFLRMKQDEWDSVINTNLSSIFRVAKAAIRPMTKAKFGRIINISSVIGSMGNPGQANYGAAKAGIEGFSRSLAKEIASRNITVNSIAPGFIQTDMTDELTEEQKANILTNVPANRLGQPDEIADLVAFLASDSAGYITGETVHINGGLYMG